MEFEVVRFSKYRKLRVVCDDGTLHTGLLDDGESKQLAVNLVGSAADMLRGIDPESSEKLIDLYNEMSEQSNERG